MVRLLLLLLLAAPALPLPLRLPPAGGCAFPVGGLDVNSRPLRVLARTLSLS